MKFTVVDAQTGEPITDVERQRLASLHEMRGEIQFAVCEDGSLVIVDGYCNSVYLAKDEYDIDIEN